MICPRCRNEVSDLVSRFEIHNMETGKGESFSYGHSICEICVDETVLEIQEMARRDGRSNHNA